jgi:serine/threonine protein kinase
MSVQQGVSVGGTAEALQRAFSALRGASPAPASGRERSAQPDEPTDLVQAVRTRLAEGQWRFRLHRSWCDVQPSGHRPRAHGWLLHLSATPDSAASVLDRVVPVLREHGVAFRFATSTDAVGRLMGGDAEPSARGSFLTVYPRDDAQAPHLAAALHTATVGMSGPRILAERPIRAGSLVHYRHGRFEDAYDLDDDGVLRPVDADRASKGASDSAGGDSAGETTAGEDSGGASGHGHADIPPGMVLRERFVLRGLLDQSVTGGRYLAVDRTNDREVLVKHVRAHRGADPTGADVRERLHLEAAVLRHLDGEVPVPRVVEVFDRDGDRFLVTEHPHGQAFLDWIHTSHNDARATANGHPLLMARRLVALLASVHAAGMVLRNLGPDSILVAPNGALTLVDLDDAVPVGEPAPPTPPSSYQAPECRHPHRGDAGASRIATVAEDLWSLGALFFLLATGAEPDLPADEPADRPLRDRLAAWLAVVEHDGPSAATLGPPLLGLLATTPDCRWSLARVEKALAGRERRPTGTGRLSGVRLPTAAHLVRDGLDHLRDAAAAPLQSHVSTDPGTDPGSVRHGAAGVLGTLVQAYVSAREPDPLQAAVRDLSARLVAHRPPGQSSRALPGLLTGRSGTAWALADAGAALHDPALLAAARDMLASLPMHWPLAGVAHGLAGAGLAHLHVGRLTSDRSLLDRACGYADAVVAAGQASRHGPFWPVPADARSRLAGSCHYGFAHGVAGVGYFLLVMAHETGDEAYAKVAVAAGHTLCEAATADPDGAAWWPIGPDHPAPSPHRSVGPAGIGTFLLRLYAVTGEPGIGAYAVAAAVAVHKARWRLRSGGSHGLAASGHYLIDVAQVLGDDRYRTWADDVAEAMAARHCRRAGRLLVPDQVSPPTGANPSGLAGVAGASEVADGLSFLVRLGRGGPRPWMVDECLAAPVLEIAGEDLTRL